MKQNLLSTFNVQRSKRAVFKLSGWLLLAFCCWSTPLLAQAPVPTPAEPLDPLLQLMMSQPSIEVTSNLLATAVFDPMVVKPGENAIYRFSVNALNDSVRWPDAIPFPDEHRARFTARGQSLAIVPGEPKLRPQTAINYHTRPAAEGVFTVPEFEIEVYGRKVIVPAATLHVSVNASSAPPQRLALELTRTNCYVGQPVPVRVLLKTGNVVQSVQEIKLNGDGFLVDFANVRQSISGAPDGSGAAYVYETTLAPLRAGELTFAAQGFTAGNMFAGGVVIRGQVTIPGGPPEYRLLDSEPVTLRVQSLPKAGELPGFTGAIGQFRVNPPQLSTNRLRVGETLKLTVAIEGQSSLNRLVAAPPPRTTNWQVFPAERSGAAPVPNPAAPVPANVATFVYTLIPLTADADQTPVIPFSYFDPEMGRYVDASISSVPVEVEPGETTLDPTTFAALTRISESERKLELSDITKDPGRAAATLKPLQYRGWFIALQILPLVGFIGLWQWDRRRRFHEQHPEILIRRRARRAVKRARREAQQALARGDGRAYVAKAVRALQLAAAPLNEAEPRALVGRDVTPLLPNSQAGELVRRLFATADALGFSTHPVQSDEMLRLHSEVEQALSALEAQL